MNEKVCKNTKLKKTFLYLNVRKYYNIVKKTQNTVKNEYKKRNPNLIFGKCDSISKALVL